MNRQSDVWKDETVYVVLCDILVRRSGDVRVLRVLIRDDR